MSLADELTPETGSAEETLAEGTPAEAAEQKPEAAAVEPAAEPKEQSLSTLPGNWYVLHVFSGYENKVKTAIDHRIKELNLGNVVHKVLIPEEEVIEVKNNKRVERTKKMFPGYVFINMEVNDNAWAAIRRINGVARFVGSDMPESVPENEVMRVLRQTGEKVKKIEIDYEINEVVKVISGPFRGYVGEIKDINPERGKVKVMILIFGRETPMELDFDQIEKNG